MPPPVVSGMRIGPGAPGIPYPPGTAYAGAIAGVRRRRARKAINPTTTITKATAMANAATGKEDAGEAFSGHCEEGIVLSGAALNWALAWVAASVATSSLSET